jgi:hypothetical protein
MKKFIIAALVLVFLSCKKDTDSTVINGKVVYRSCASVVVQVTDSSHFYLGENGWRQGPTKAALDHVFTVLNPCKFGNIPVGQAITFTLVKNDPSWKDCVVCALFDNAPRTKHDIKVINPSVR